jgi:branched-subunit amino acid transport protein AzlD
MNRNYWLSTWNAWQQPLVGGTDSCCTGMLCWGIPFLVFAPENEGQVVQQRHPIGKVLQYQIHSRFFCYLYGSLYFFFKHCVVNIWWSGYSFVYESRWSQPLLHCTINITTCHSPSRQYYLDLSNKGSLDYPLNILASPCLITLSTELSPW